MQKELKDEIIKYVWRNEDEFQLVNATTAQFRTYIYDSQGEYLIGGEKVANFISEFIALYEN